MRLRLPGKWDLSAFATFGWAFTTVVGRTMRLRIQNDSEVMGRLARKEGQLLVTWHGRTLVPLFQYRHRGFVTVISPSRDGEIQNRIFGRFGWEAVRGSSGRNAARAALGSVRWLREGRTMAISPDGPKGPPGVVQPGTLYLAKKSGCPVIPAGVSAWPAWHLGSWDSYMFPKPFARTAIIFGEPVFVPPDASEEWMAAAAQRLGAQMDALQEQADRLVGRKPSLSPARDGIDSTDSRERNAGSGTGAPLTGE